MTTETKVEAVAWRYRLNEKGNGPWGPGPWGYETRKPTLTPSGFYDLEPLYPSSALDALRGEVERLRGERSALIARIQSAVTNVAIPKMTESRAEYFKAGARAAIAAVNDALTGAGPT